MRLKRTGLALFTALMSLSACGPDGAALFKKEKCSGCHSFADVKEAMGIDLTYVTERRSDSWIRQQLTDPKVNNPNSSMPNYGHLSGSDVRGIIKYLKSGPERGR